MPDLPRDNVVGAGGVPAESEAADDLTGRAVEGKSATENNDAAVALFKQELPRLIQRDL